MKMLLEKIDKEMKIDTAMHGLDAVAKVIDLEDAKNSNA